jgi:hypothetical protein
MKLTQTVRKHTAEHANSEEQMLQRKIEESSRKFSESVVEVYANA